LDNLRYYFVVLIGQILAEQLQTLVRNTHLKKSALRKEIRRREVACKKMTKNLFEKFAQIAKALNGKKTSASCSYVRPTLIAYSATPLFTD